MVKQTIDTKNNEIYKVKNIIDEGEKTIKKLEEDRASLKLSIAHQTQQYEDKI